MIIGHGTRLEAVGSRVGLDRPDLRDDRVHRRGHLLVHLRRIGTFHEEALVPVALEERFQFLMRNSRQNGGPGDLIAVEMQDGQHRAVPRRIRGICSNANWWRRVRSPLRHRPRRSRRTDPDCRTRRHKRAAANTPARRLRGSTPAFAAPRGSESRPEKRTGGRAAAYLLRFAGYRIDLGVGAFEVSVCHHPRPAVARPAHVDRVQVMRLDHAVHVGVDEVQPGGCAPVAEQPRLDMLPAQRFAQKGIVHQVDLAHREVIRGAPPGVDETSFVGVQNGEAPVADCGMRRMGRTSGSSSHAVRSG